MKITKGIKFIKNGHVSQIKLQSIYNIQYVIAAKNLKEQVLRNDEMERK